MSSPQWDENYSLYQTITEIKCESTDPRRWKPVLTDASLPRRRVETAVGVNLYQTGYVLY